MVASVGIIGAGWLGQPLAQALLLAGHNVIATGQSTLRLSELAALGIDHHALSLPMPAEQLAKLPVFKQDILIIAIPPQFKHGQVNYPEKVSNIVAGAELTGVKQLILLNSTAIANGLSGAVTEFSELNYDANKVGILAQAELNALAFNGDCRVLRLAGLIGPKRHPGRFISATRVMPNPSQPVNLIHQTDVIGLLMAIITKFSAGELSAEHRIYHGVSSTHVSRQAFYQQAAQALALAKPKFAAQIEQAEQAKGKLINDDWTRAELAYQYQHDDLIVWLGQSVNGQ